MLVSVLIATGFLLACGLVLAALLLLAEKKILNYGPCEIDINNGEKKLTLPGGGSLLAALADHQIFIPSACGGRGSCAYCKLQVLAGGGAIGPVEEPYLSAAERAQNVRLACQVKLKRPLKIMVPQDLFAVRRYRGILEHKRPLTSDIVELRIALQEPGAITFQAGQYVQLESPAYADREPVMRAYSLSSIPSDNRHVELIIRLVPNGICTTWVFNHLQEGQDITFSGPFGHFHLSETQAPVIGIAGGSGMAPLWSIFRDMREKGIHRPATYFFGALTQKDLFFVDELRRLETELPGFKFIPALSKEPEGSPWPGERGLITDVVARHFPDTSQCEAYLCGSPGMIDASVAVLTKHGMPESSIYYDKFA